MAAALRGLLADTRPLADPHFRRLWQANIVTVIGAQVTVVAVPAQIYALTGSSAYVGLTGVFGLVPLVVFGLWGGALADAMDRRTLLIVSTLGLIVTSGLFYAQAALGNTDYYWGLDLSGTLQGAGGIGGLIFLRHHQNIRRLIKGEEPKIGAKS